MTVALDFAEEAYLAVLTDGGLTQHPFNQTVPTYGYASSYAADTVIVGWDDFSPTAVEHYVSSHDWTDPRVYLGIWLDEYSDTLYLDRSRVFEDIIPALTFAIDNNRRAIYDIARRETLYLEQREGAA